MKEPFARLRSLFSSDERLAALEAVPGRLEAVVSRFEETNPRFRDDVFAIIETSLTLAEMLSDETYNAKTGVSRAVELQATIGRIILHLEDRATLTGYGVLVPSTRSLHQGFFATPNEANRALDGLHRLGLEGGAEVVPVIVVAGTAVRPRALPAQIAQSVTEVEEKISDAVLIQKLEKDVS